MPVTDDVHIVGDGSIYSLHGKIDRIGRVGIVSVDAIAALMRTDSSARDVGSPVFLQSLHGTVVVESTPVGMPTERRTVEHDGISVGIEQRHALDMQRFDKSCYRIGAFTFCG